MESQDEDEGNVEVRLICVFVMGVILVCWFGMVVYVSSCYGWYRDWETDRKSTRLNSSHRL